MNRNNDERFLEILSFALTNTRSDLYRNKYGKAGFTNPLETILSLEDVSLLPLLAKEELLSAPPKDLQFVDDSEVKLVSYTSGTTGKPLVVRFSDFAPTYDSFDEVGNGSVLVLLPAVLGAYIYNRFVKLHSKGPTILGDIHNMPATMALAAQINTVMISTSPTLAVLMKKYLSEYPQLQQSLKYLRVGSEFFTAAKKRYLQELYPNVSIFANYASCEGNRIAYQCEHLAKSEGDNYYHVHTFEDGEPILHLEVIDPVSERPVELGEQGELVITNLYNKALPLIRYRTGDLVSLHGNKCSCGVTGLLLRSWGRSNFDLVRAGGFELRRDMFEPAVLTCEGINSEYYEVHVYEEILNGKLMIRVRFELTLNGNVVLTSELEKKIRTTLTDNTKISSNFTLAEAVEKGIFHPIDIKFVEHNRPRGNFKAHARIFLH